MPGNTIHLMPDDEILEYMQALIAGRQLPNLFASQPLEAGDFPILIQISKHTILNRALQANVDLADLRKGSFECEFDIYPFASNPKLVERHTDRFATFIESLDFGL